MEFRLYDNILTIFYLLAWVFTLIWYQRKERTFDAGSAIIISYVCYAFFSLLSLNDELFSDSYEPLTLFPFIYLYGMLMLSLLPAIYHHLHPTDTISPPQTRIIYIICIISIICSIGLIGDLSGNVQQGLFKIVTDSDAGNDAYKEQAKEAADNARGGIENLLSVIYNSISDIIIFVFFYLLTTYQKNKIMVGLMLFCVTIGMVSPVMHGQRTGIMMTVFSMIVGYMVFKRYLSATVNRIAKIIGICFLSVVSIPLIAITFSRFASRAAGVMGYLTWYIGQANLYFNNYALDAGGTRNGDRVINLFKRLIDSDTPSNYVERREMYKNLAIDDHLFTTFVGDFCIDFGPLLAVIIFLVFYLWVLSRIQTENKTILLHQLYLLYFTMCISMQGGMYLFAYADTANLKIITAMLFYGYLVYHELLLKKFPLQNRPTPCKP